MATNSTPMLRYTIMPDFGGAYGWINRSGDDFLGPCAEIDCLYVGRTPPGHLLTALEDWQRVFECAQHEHVGGFGPPVDWPQFHAEGHAMARLLKADLGDAAQVCYQKPMEDPDHRFIERIEVLRDGTFVHWPKIRRLRVSSLAKWPSVVTSGRHTGVDRAAQQWATGCGMKHGAWCSKDGALIELDRLIEMDAAGNAECVRANVVLATTTLLLIEGPLTGGSLLIAKLAERLGRSYGVFPIDAPNRVELANGIRGWLAGEDIERLNIAGPSEARCPGVHLRAAALLEEVFDPSRD